MGIYSITMHIKKDVMHNWIDWMQSDHINDVMSYGFFKKYEFFRIIIPDASSDEVTFQIHYHFDSIEDYYKYAEVASPDLQRKQSEKFAGKFKASRAILVNV